MPTSATPDSFERAVLAALQTETRRIIEEEGDRAAAQVRQRIQALVGQIVLSALLDYEVYRNGVDLTIKVKNVVAVDPPAPPS